MVEGMEYRTLGRSGCAVSTLALGTMTFGTETDEDGAHAQLDRFLEAGGNLVDTADVYTRGASEEIIGRWLANAGRGPRPGGAGDQGPVPDGGRAERRRPVAAAPRARAGRLARRLRRRRDRPLPGARLGPADAARGDAAFLDDAVRAGKVRYVGLSNFTGWQLQRAVDLAERRGLAAPVTLQPQYNLLVREIEWEIVPACQANGLGLLPWSPLGGGWLTGKYAARRAARPGRPGWARTRTVGSRPTTARSRAERTWDVVDAVRAVAEARGVHDGAGRPGLAGRPAGRHVGDPRRAHHRAAGRQPRRRRTASHR